MNKQQIFNIVLALGLIVSLALNISSKSTGKSDTTENTKDSIPSSGIIPLPKDSIETAAGTSEAVKVGYFVLEELVKTSPYLNRKTQELIEMERKLYQSAQNKERELMEYQKRKSKELEELNSKNLLSQTFYEGAQRDLMEKQQNMQQDLQREEMRLNERKQAFLQERDKVIFDAVKSLNEVLKLDYVLVDNMDIRLVVPLSERNDITKDLAKLINKNFK